MALLQHPRGRCHHCPASYIATRQARMVDGTERRDTSCLRVGHSRQRDCYPNDNDANNAGVGTKRHGRSWRADGRHRTTNQTNTAVGRLEHADGRLPDGFLPIASPMFNHHLHYL